jgi:hypothetical protein
LLSDKEKSFTPIQESSYHALWDQKKNNKSAGTKKFGSFCNKKEANTQLVEGGANYLLHV